MFLSAAPTKLELKLPAFAAKIHSESTTSAQFALRVNLLTWKKLHVLLPVVKISSMQQKQLVSTNASVENWSFQTNASVAKAKSSALTALNASLRAQKDSSSTKSANNASTSAQISALSVKPQKFAQNVSKVMFFQLVRHNANSVFWVVGNAALMISLNASSAEMVSSRTKVNANSVPSAVHSASQKLSVLNVSMATNWEIPSAKLPVPMVAQNVMVKNAQPVQNLSNWMLVSAKPTLIVYPPTAVELPALLATSFRVMMSVCSVEMIIASTASMKRSALSANSASILSRMSASPVNKTALSAVNSAFVRSAPLASTNIWVSVSHVAATVTPASSLLSFASPVLKAST